MKEIFLLLLYYNKMRVALIHILFVAPLLIYIGLRKPQQNWVYFILFILGIGVLLNFLTKIVRQDNWNQRTVWYAIHMLLFASLLLYVGWYGVKAADVSYSLLLAVGIAAFGYHSIRLIQQNLK